MHLPQLMKRSPGPEPSSNASTFANLFPFSVGLNGVDQDTNWLSVYVVVGMFIAAITFTLLLQFLKMGMNHFRHMCTIGNPSMQTYWQSNRTRWHPWLKQHLLYAPVWKNRHSEEISISKKLPTMGSFPGRSHFILCLFYTAANIAWCVFLPYHEPRAQTIAALRGRSGMLAVLNLFPTVVFALRNNPFIPLLKVPYDTFNLYHRWAARIFILETMVHMGAWMENTRSTGGWIAVSKGLSEGPHSTSFSWGLVAATTAFIILIQTWSPLRHTFYEVFLHLHKLFVLVTMVGIWFHLKIDHLPQLLWINLIFAIWAYEYVARAYRVIRYNINTKQFGSRITVEAMPGEACRVTFHLANNWTPRPGAHVHAYFPGLTPWTPWTSHPFSVAWAEQNKVGPVPVDEKTGLPMSQQDLDKNLDHVEKYTTDVSLIIRVRGGFTKKLHQLASAAPNNKLTTWGFMEGFYGGQDRLDSYGNVLLFAGGVGITHQIMFTKQLLEGYNKGTNSARRITLIWSAPNTECLEWIRPWMNKVLAMPGRRECVKIILHITRPVHNREFSSMSGSVSMSPGRVFPQEIIDNEILDRTGAISVTVCGPGPFADSVRVAARKRVGICALDFTEEAFTY